MRLAWLTVSYNFTQNWRKTYIFDVRAWMNSDDVTMLNSKIVSDHAVHPRTSIVQVIIGQDYQDCIFPLLALNKHSVATEKL
jgi:hypothetical protein